MICAEYIIATTASSKDWKITQSASRSYAFSVVIFYAVVEVFDVLSGDTGVQFSGSVTFLSEFAVFQQSKIPHNLKLSYHCLQQVESMRQNLSPTSARSIRRHATATGISDRCIR
ncbi:hypothetical protein NPIL_688611 [Nephila pilipes]|uniref:Uncharacterized protein n=1 Tax=Nephila pilipes TaxID=299642 RepID=A0A8X6PPB3_NEPPI|nr:hypothetical protein NPIL_688611 [Nephila pilipes]